MSDYKLVPAEPTIEMLAELGFNGDYELAVGHAALCADLKARYRAMLAAAPAVQVEPVAYAVFADNGNIRIWSADPVQAKTLMQEYGDQVRLLYTAPPAPAAPVQQTNFISSNGEYRNPSYQGQHDGETPEQAAHRLHWVTAAIETERGNAAPDVQVEPVVYLRKDQLRQVQRMGPMLGEIADSPRVDRVPVYAAPQPAEQQPSAGDSLTSVPDEVLAAEFAAWWDEHGQFCRAGGGTYERTFAFEAWRHLYPQLMNLQMAAAEQQPAPDTPGLTEALRQYQHNDGSGLVFGYDKLLVGRYVAQLIEALELFVSNPTPTSEDFDMARNALAAYRKQGGWP